MLSRSEQCADAFHGASDHGSRAAFHDRTLDQLRMLDHQHDDLVIREFSLADAQLTVSGLARAEQFARGDAELGDQFA